MAMGRVSLPQEYTFVPNGMQELSMEASPNHGVSLPEEEAVSSNRESSAEWQKRNGIDPAKQIRLVRIGHMRYQHPDLAEITQFLRGS